MGTISVFAFDPYPVVVEGLRSALDACDDLRLEGISFYRETVVEQISALGPSVALIDASQGTATALRMLMRIRAAAPQSQCVLWVTQWSEAESFRALQGGARGVLKKTLPLARVIECLRAVGSGNVWIESSAGSQSTLPDLPRSTSRLTPREREIMDLLCRGMKNKDIGAALKIATGTVKVHLMHIFEKTGARDRFDLAISAHRHMGGHFESAGIGAPRAGIM